MDPTNLTPIGDQYSLGCILYYCVTGRYPFPDGSAVEKMMAHQTKQPTPLRELNPEVPEELAAIIERLMQKAPANRFGNVTELIDALRRWAAPMPQSSREIPRLSVTAGPRAARPAPSVSEATPRPNAKGATLARALGAGVPPVPNRTSFPVATPVRTRPGPEFKQPTPARAWPQPEAPPRWSLDEGMGSATKIGVALVFCIAAYLVMRFFL
jgi:serine/threonine-protein kinase